MVTISVRISGTLPVGGSPQVKIGIQRGEDVVDRVGSNQPVAVFTFPIEARVDDYGDLDLGGPYIHGRPGARFVYLVWETAIGDLIGRTKIHLSTAPGDLLEQALERDETVNINLSLIDQRGRPRFASVPDQVITWHIASNREPISATRMSAR